MQVQCIQNLKAPAPLAGKCHPHDLRGAGASSRLGAKQSGAESANAILLKLSATPSPGTVIPCRTEG
jgi:hypothetical protein